MFLKSYIEKRVSGIHPIEVCGPLKEVLFKENETDDGEHGNQCRCLYQVLYCDKLSKDVHIF